MPRLLLALALTASMIAAHTRAQTPAPASAVTLRSVLLDELRSTHNKADWFVPLNTAVAGLTPEQARWVPTNAAGKLDPDASHSVGMLAIHVLFYNRRALARLQGTKPQDAPADNEETFNSFTPEQWNATVQGLDDVMQAIEQWVQHADEAQLLHFSRLLADIATHNAYHTGQILYVRKLEGSWNPANGVK